MNRHERRKRAAQARRHQTTLYNDYIRHLPECGPPVLGVSGVTHVVYLHDDWCSIYEKGGGLENCNCNPHVRYHAEPRRS